MIIVAVALLGLVLGSFVNALVWRLHEQAKLDAHSPKGKEHAGHGKKPQKAQAAALTPQDLSITKGRSMCPSCHHTLAARDLVPVASWLYLRGKCRYCQKPIPDSPIVELTTALLFVVAYLAWPFALHGVGLFQFVSMLFFVVLFVALAVYDLRWFLLPNRLVFPLTAVVMLETVVVAIWRAQLAALWQPLVGAAIIFGLFYGLFQVSKGKWIGAGDVKLAAGLGLLAGSASHAFLVIFLASFLGTLASIPLLAGGKKNLKVHIPFGPYLLMATFLVVLFGGKIITWYMGLFLAN